MANNGWSLGYYKSLMKLKPDHDFIRKAPISKTSAKSKLLKKMIENLWKDPLSKGGLFVQDIATFKLHGCFQCVREYAAWNGNFHTHFEMF